MRIAPFRSPDARPLPPATTAAATRAASGLAPVIAPVVAPVVAPVIALIVALFGAGCGGKASPFKPVVEAAPPAVAPASARIEHVVLIELLDPADAADLKSDSDRLIPTIPDVRGYVSGTPVDIGRGNVSRDYHVGLIVRFDSVEGYKAYLAHPAHEQLVQKWRPRWRKAYIVDFAP